MVFNSSYYWIFGKIAYLYRIKLSSKQIQFFNKFF